MPRPQATFGWLCLFWGLKIKTTIYIDGFNLYKGALVNTPYKWLDVKRMCSHVLPDECEITCIRYFTAKVKPTDDDPKITERQSVYLRALEAYIPELIVHRGNFTERPARAPLLFRKDGSEARHWDYLNHLKIGKIVTYLKREEKKTDVNIAVHLLNDAWSNKHDCAVLLSDDSDLSEALNLAKQRGKKIGLITKSSAPTKALKKHSDFHRHIKKHHLKNSQLPENIPDTELVKPNEWSLHI